MNEIEKLRLELSLLRNIYKKEQDLNESRQKEIKKLRKNLRDATMNYGFLATIDIAAFLGIFIYIFTIDASKFTKAGLAFLCLFAISYLWRSIGKVMKGIKSVNRNPSEKEKQA